MINEIEVEYEEIKLKKKHCNKCGEVKHLTQFTKVKKVKGGRGGICSVCTNKRNTYRYRHEEEFRQKKIKASQNYRDNLKDGKL